MFFSISTDFVFAIFHQKKGGAQIFNIYELYNPNNTLDRNLVTLIGRWNKSCGLTVWMNESKFYRRSNLHLMKLKASYLVTLIWDMIFFFWNKWICFIKNPRTQVTFMFQVSFKPNGTDLTRYLKHDKNLLEDALAKFGYRILYHLSEIYNFTWVLNVWSSIGDPAPAPFHVPISKKKKQINQ